MKNYTPLNTIIFSAKIVYSIPVICVFLVTGCVGLSPSHTAIKEGNLDTLERMLNDGQNANTVGLADWHSGRTTLLIDAAIRGNTDACALLLEKGANINKAHVVAANYTFNFWGTPIMGAIISGNIETLKLLVDNGADIHRNISMIPGGGAEGSLQKHSPLMNIAAATGNTNICNYLIDLKLDPNGNDKCSVTPVVEAARRGQITMTQFLIEQGVALDVNEKDPIGSAMLSHFAADYYLNKNEQQSLMFYEQAARYYSEAEDKLHGEAMSDALFSVLVSAAGVMLQVSAAQNNGKFVDGAFTRGSFADGTFQVYTYHTPAPASSTKHELAEYYGQRGKICSRIASKHRAGKPLAECVKDEMLKN